MEMNKIEFVRFLGYDFNEIEMMSERRNQLASIQSKCPFADRSQSGRGLRISTRIKSYVMSQLYKAFSNI